MFSNINFTKQNFGIVPIKTAKLHSTNMNPMKRILLFVFFSSTFLCSQAQWVNIPDSNFGKWLTTTYPTCMQGDPQVGFQMDTSCGGIVNEQYVDCNNMYISDLDGIQHFRSLGYLDCHSNMLSYIPPLPSTLIDLNCLNNQLSSLPDLPNTLNSLNCAMNQLTSLPTLPTSLTNLICAKNQLANLPTLPSLLSDIRCGGNMLSSLPILPSSLLLLFCEYNQLISLPILPNTLIHLNCSFNPNLSCIPSKLGNMNSLSFSNTNITCLPNRFNCIQYDINPNSLPLCTPQSGCFSSYNIDGNVHQYITSNCLQDSITPGTGLVNIKLLLQQNGQTVQQTYTDIHGEYVLKTDSNIGYTITVDTNGLQLNVSCPTSFNRNVVLTITDSLKLNENFGLECKGRVDVGVSSIQGRFRAGSVSNVNIVAGDIIKQYYNANCASNVAGTVVISFTGSVTYVNPAVGALTPTSVSGNTLSYTVNDFSALPLNAFDIILATDTHAVIGSLICITVNVSTAVDINLANNTLSQCFQVVNSYDPNAKEVYPKYISRNGDWLTYTVHFQNTGNDTAYDIVVRDTLSNFVDANSFQFLASSHEKKIIQIKGNAVAFTFPNINLVDSATNPAGSQGWFQFKVKTKSTLQLLTNINNTAFIYFDFNPAIKTNTATTVVEPLGINETENASVLQLYPNPNNGSFTLHTQNQIGQAWQLTDVLGRPLAKGVVEKEYELILLKGSNAGVYIFTCAGQQIRLIVE